MPFATVFSVMMLYGRMFYFASATTARLHLEVGTSKGANVMKEIKERKKVGKT
jgi:hypothetical protein